MSGWPSESTHVQDIHNPHNCHQGFGHPERIGLVKRFCKSGVPVIGEGNSSTV